MAKYLKPQTPLQHQSGDYIYPITTVDQVITAKGERLNANLISVDLNESVESDTNINLVNNKPKAGFIYPLASNVVPEGFLLCDGAEYLRAEYPELFAVIGTMYGEGDGSTTFNVPNLQNNNMQPYTVVNYIIATGKDTGVSVADIITGVQALPLGIEYGGTGATNISDIHRNLGIKANAQNLLDNSDFRNPVNQRGFVSGTTVMGYEYFIDRWRADSTGITPIISNEGITAPSSAFYQTINTLTHLVGAKVTLAFGLSDGSIGVFSGTVTNNNDWTDICRGTKNDVSAYMANPTTDVWTINLSPNGKTISWVALYEGEYTEETLPEYHPKGYAAELLECKRYYQHFDCADFIKMYHGVTEGWALFRDYQSLNMRAIPTVTVGTVTNYNSQPIEVVSAGHLNGIIGIIFKDNTDTITFRALPVNLSADL